MLVLRRRLGETILIGNDVEIEIIEISRSRVKLGVRAPCSISVIRKETLAVSQENQLASDLIASQGPDGVDKLLQLLNPAAAKIPVAGPVKHGTLEEGSTKSGRRRYVTSERYSGYREDRENPHPV